MKSGVLSLNRFNGQEQFTTSNEVIYVVENQGNFVLNFHIQTEKEAIMTLPDTEELKANPKAEFIVHLNEFSWQDFVGKSYEIPNGYDTKTDEYLTSLYYCDHEPTDENVISILERKEDRFRVLVTATRIDVNYYDGSKPKTKVMIDAWFEAKYERNNLGTDYFR